MGESTLLASLQQQAVDEGDARSSSHHHRSSRDDDRHRRRHVERRDDERRGSRDHGERRGSSDRRRDDERRSHRSSRRSSTDRDRGRESTSSSSAAVPLHERVSRTGAWDKPPPGCEGMTPSQVKNSGLFPVPGQPSKNTYLAATGGPMSAYGYNPEVFGAMSARGPSNIKSNRRVYVGNIPNSVREVVLTDFLNSTMRQQKLTTGASDPIEDTEMHRDKGYALVTFKSSEEASAALSLDGSDFSGVQLEIRRPKDTEDAVMNTATVGGVSQNVPDGPHKLFLGSIPSYLGEEQVLELLRAFGEVKAFVLVRDSHTGASKGFAFVEYADHDLEEIACQGLTGMEVGDKKLVLQRSSTTGGGFKNNRDGGGLASSAMPMLPMDILQSIGRNLAPPTSVLLLLNMISGIDVQADEDYEEIYVDIEDEASRHGTIEQIVIPRPKEGEEVPGVGKIFVKFASMDDCIMAQKAIAGRQFNDRAVITAYYDEDKFKNGEY